MVQFVLYLVELELDFVTGLIDYPVQVVEPPELIV